MRTVVAALVAAHAQLAEALGYDNPVTVKVGRMALANKRSEARQELFSLQDELRLPKPRPRAEKAYLCILNQPYYQRKIRSMDRSDKIAAIKEVRADYEVRHGKSLDLLYAKLYVEKMWGGYPDDFRLTEFLKSEEIPL